MILFFPELTNEEMVKEVGELLKEYYFSKLRSACTKASVYEELFIEISDNRMLEIEL